MLGTGTTPVAADSKAGAVPLGYWLAGAGVVLALADTRAAPAVIAFLSAVALYNALPLLQRVGATPKVG